MTQSRLVFKRDILYQEVWTAPIRTVAKRYGLSDVGLKKICIKLNIPVPPQGFWLRKRLGHSIVPTPLPRLRPGEPAQHEVTQQRSAVQIEPESDVDKMILSETDSGQAIKVSERLTHPHPLVAKTDAALKGKKPDDKGLVYPLEKGCLDFAASPGMMNRALRIADALIKALEARGHKVEVKDKDYHRITFVTIVDTVVEFGIREPYRQREAAVQKHSWRKMEYYASGALAVSIKSWLGDGLQATWTDTKTQRIEDRMNDIVVGFVRAAAKIRQENIEREKRHRAYEEARRQEEERRKKRQEELERFEGLKKKVSRWRQAEEIRAYVAAVRGSGDLEEERERWCEWALMHADRIDPLVKSPLHVLDEG
jgi:hypothetical protein